MVFFDILIMCQVSGKEFPFFTAPETWLRHCRTIEAMRQGRVKFSREVGRALLNGQLRLRDYGWW
jgi:hypothetical protein